MAGGKFDSSLTRVQPAFTWLGNNGGPGWPSRLIHLASRGDRVRRLGLDDSPVNVEFEKPFRPPTTLLEYYLRHPERLRWPEGAKFCKETSAKRKALLEGNVAVQREALGLLAECRSPSAKWFVFEGTTMVDAVISTPSCMILVEGKRTEPGLTSKIEWDVEREQIYRNLDAAEACPTRPQNFLCLLVVSEGSRCERDAQALDAAGSERAVRSMPYRAPEEVSRVWDEHYAGWTTWEALMREWPLMRLP